MNTIVKLTPDEIKKLHRTSYTYKCYFCNYGADYSEHSPKSIFIKEQRNYYTTPIAGGYWVTYKFCSEHCLNCWILRKL